MKSNAVLALSALLLLAADAAKFPAWDSKESIPDYAKRVHLEPSLALDLGDNLKLETALIPAGTFTMGSPKGEAKTPAEAASELQHKVTLSQPFYIGKFEITQAQYEKVMGNNPSKIKGPDLPVGNITVKDAEDFCEKLGKSAHRSIKLPTEAQWEYACRAGTTTAYCSGDTIADLDKVAWFGANSGGKIHPVGQKAPNAWGLYDMHGNAREYTRDLFVDAPQPDSTDPTGPKDGDAKNHVVRGGAYTANAEKAGNCRSASRRPTEGLSSNGFRIIVEIDAK